MSAQDVRDRLDERFLLPAGGQCGLERHQTLRQAVALSWDLLDEPERGCSGRARCSPADSTWSPPHTSGSPGRVRRAGRGGVGQPAGRVPLDR
jgi:hypothetical protein